MNVLCQERPPRLDPTLSQPVTSAFPDPWLTELLLFATNPSDELLEIFVGFLYAVTRCTL